eukprot:9112678-Pyramimonas_sp.AAC.1
MKTLNTLLPTGLIIPDQSLHQNPIRFPNRRRECAIEGLQDLTPAGPRTCPGRWRSTHTIPLVQSTRSLCQCRPSGADRAVA